MVIATEIKHTVQLSFRAIVVELGHSTLYSSAERNHEDDRGLAGNGTRNGLWHCTFSPLAAADTAKIDSRLNGDN